MGEATALNQAVAAIPDQGQQPQMPEEQVQPAQAADYEPQFEPMTEDEAFLTGPSTRPDEALTTGTTPQPRVPPHVRKQLPALQAAAQAPGASAELQALVSYLLRSS